MRSFLAFLSRCLLWLRYRIRVVGLEKIQGKTGKTVIFPNHPGYVDPTILISTLWPYLKPRPTLYEDNFKGVLAPIAWLLNAVKVPDLEQASEDAAAKAQLAVKAVIEGLQRGENHILWPAGRIQ